VEPVEKESPRAVAIKNGERWYMPNRPCPKCGKMALKYVANGVCKGCMECAEIAKEDGRETADTIMMRENPDLIISRKDAQALGFKIYRTGEFCRRGHTSYRYVSTGQCIECLRGDKSAR